ncbi:hypothetical protein ACNI3K_11230 [Demequina sp. SO4-13]|uniref:hypothetical protein n=1 Tax=Demequina sp. SO4-13 TaxID=3401027 RepID=UPI003AF450E4
MWIVTRAEVGRLAFGRLVRDGIVAPLIPGVALPRDVPDAPRVRRHVLAQCVPLGCQATGAAALWAHGEADTPSVIHARGPAGRHVRNWTGPLPVVFHGVGVAPPGGAVADVDTAVADALRWAELQTADAVAAGQYGRRLAPVRRRAS